MSAPTTVDEIDTRILSLLRENAKRPLREIAEAVGLTIAPVQRRIARLERTGVISRYTVEINYERIASGIEAVTELRFVGDLELAEIIGMIESVPEVEEVLTMAGDPDALVRIRVSGVEHLGRVVSRLRSAKGVAGTKTLVILDSWTRFS